MIIYQINAFVREDLADSFEEYMSETHMPDVVATGFFESAEMESFEDSRYRIRYHLKTREMLDTYLATKAEGLRQDFISNFPEGVDLSRDVFEEEEEAPDPEK